MHYKLKFQFGAENRSGPQNSVKIVLTNQG